jgi:hypothetical protein
VRRAGNVLTRLLVAAHHIDGDRQHVSRGRVRIYL